MEETQMKNKREYENGIIFLLRICTCLLAAVSFWATAQGMIGYTFPKSWQAYAASLGIQGLLLGLNFSLPAFLRQCKEKGQKVALYLLTLVILFCSSWFSYLYISRQAYNESWETERRLLAQAVYREEMFNANVYIELYSQNIQNELMEQVTELYQQAMEMDQNNVDVSENLDWSEERNIYTADDFAVKDIMDSAISAMENATGENATADMRQQAVSVLSGMQSNLRTEIESLGTQIANIDERVATAESNLRGAENRLKNAPEGVDLTPYQNTVNQAVQTYENLIARQNDLEDQQYDYESALQRTTYYLTVLGMTEDGISSYFVGANLRAIQSELFATSPDATKMQASAAEIFNRLQSAVDLGSDISKYQNVLTGMNVFLRTLENYSAIKESGNAIQIQIDGLAEGTLLSLEAGESLASWREQFNDLKSKISGLPVYTLQDVGNSKLNSFDREDSLKNLDYAVRFYLTEHNIAQSGLIYLLCPFREMALFSLFLAFLLDIAAFITGVIIDRVSSRRECEKEIISDAYESGGERLIQNGDKIISNTIKGLNRYIFLTGDYISMDGSITYKAIEDGEQTELEYAVSGLPAGFYKWDKRKLEQIDQASLLFKGVSDGPQDGIYEDCILHYEDQLLTMTQSGSRIFLGAVDTHIPVYLLSEAHYDVIYSKNISDLHGKKAVIALNKEGSRIIAIYVLE